MVYVAMVVLVAAFLSGIATWVFTLLAVAVLWFAGREGAPAWVIAGGIYVVGQILVAPFVPLVVGVLYRDLRNAGPAPAGRR